MLPSQILQAARKLIESPQTWTQHVYARNESGHSCDVDKGCRFCAEGALIRVRLDNNIGTDDDRYYAALRHLQNAAVGDPVHHNDTLGHYGTLRMYDKAIEEALRHEQNSRNHTVGHGDEAGT